MLAYLDSVGGHVLATRSYEIFRRELLRESFLFKPCPKSASAFKGQCMTHTMMGSLIYSVGALHNDTDHVCSPTFVSKLLDVKGISI